MATRFTFFAETLPNLTDIEEKTNLTVELKHGLTYIVDVFGNQATFITEDGDTTLRGIKFYGLNKFNLILKYLTTTFGLKFLDDVEEDFMMETNRLITYVELDEAIKKSMTKHGY